MTVPTQAALRMAKATEVCRWHECSRDTLYFRADGRRMRAGGRNFGRNAMVMDFEETAFIVEYPFAPSVASYQDMVDEHERTGERVEYNAERWETDSRVDEQISVYGPSVVEDWRLERLLDVLEDNEERKVAA